MMEQLKGLEFLEANEIKGMKCDVAKPYVFFSYSHAKHDAQIVMNVFKALHNSGFNIWIDTANMVHDRKSWKNAAKNALVNMNCVLAFYFRSETSMVRETIAEELETIVAIEHIKRTIAVDIWTDPQMDAKTFKKKLLNSGEFHGDCEVCERICHCVNIESKAIRLASDAGNDIQKLIEEIKEVLQENGLEGDQKQLVNKLEESSSKPADPDGPMMPPAPPIPPSEPTQSTIAFKDFLKKYNNNNFKKDTFAKLRLIGKDNYADYTTEFYDSSYELAWNFVMNILAERGEEYIHFVNGKNPGVKNPPFITKEDHDVRKARNDSVTYRQLELSGLNGYSMNRHYGQYGWIDQVLKRRMQELGLPLDAFSFEYVKDGESQLPFDNGGGVEDVRVQGGQTRTMDSGSIETYRYQKAQITYDTRTKTFTILSGSLIKAEPTTQRSKAAGLMNVYTEFLNNGKLASSQGASGYMEVLEDMPTGGSPSGVAKMVSGNSINGNLALIEINLKKNFGELHGAGESGAAGSKVNTIDEAHRFGLGGIE
ncbi:MAG: hypothetical protein HFI28_08190 [Lachnospiraceae bacterium]|jgi:hypothetical protein|nr:hypothetical protein [Lachnospiraceae bacterium]